MPDEEFRRLMARARVRHALAVGVAQGQSRQGVGSSGVSFEQLHGFQNFRIDIGSRFPPKGVEPRNR